MEVAVEGAAGVGSEAGRDTEANAVDLRGFQARAIEVQQVTGLIGHALVAKSRRWPFRDYNIRAMLVSPERCLPMVERMNEAMSSGVC